MTVPKACNADWLILIKLTGLANINIKRHTSIAYKLIYHLYCDLNVINIEWIIHSETCMVHILVCWSLTSLCHSNGHIETMPAREINPFTALTRIRSQFLRTQWSTSNHQRVDTLRLRPLSHRGWLVWYICADNTSGEWYTIARSSCSGWQC